MVSEEFKTILEHYRNPRNYGELAEADARSRLSNPLCGDVVEIFLKVEAGRISELRFRGRGCALSQASASMLTERIKGMSVEEAMRLDEEDVLRMLRVRVGPARRSCALLPLKALRKALETYLKQRARTV